MKYVVVNRENALLSRVSPDALLSWVDVGVSRATDFRYAITFETLAGACKCAQMQGGEAKRVSDLGGIATRIAGLAGSVGASRGVGDCRDAGVACLGG